MTAERKKTVVINCLVLLIMVVTIICMNLNSKVSDKTIELKNCQLDKAGLNGLVGALIDQKFGTGDAPYKLFKCIPTLPDGESIVLKFYYPKEYQFNEYQIASLKQVTSIAIGEIGIDEWNRLKGLE